jgi:hypothetical protein
MSRSNWRSNIAVRVGLATFLTRLAAFSLPSNRLQQAAHERDRSDHGPQQYSEYALRGVEKARVPVVARQKPPPANPEPKREEWRQEQDLEAQWDQAYWAKGAAIAAFISAFITAVGLWLVRQTLQANRRAVAQATEANRISKDVFVATERPWVAVEYYADGPLTFNASGAQVTIAFRVRNTGRSPARRVWVDPTLHAVDMDSVTDFTALQQQKLAQLRSMKLTNIGFTLFPDERIVQSFTLSVETAKLDRIQEQLGGLLILVVYGAVSYRLVSDDSVHLTTFSFDIRRSDRARATAKPSRALDALFIDEGDVAASDLRLDRSFVGIEHAD